MTTSATGYDRETITCPSWCNQPRYHLDTGADHVWHDRVVLELPLPEMRSDAELGRIGEGAVTVAIKPVRRRRDRMTAMPG